MRCPKVVPRPAERFCPPAVASMPMPTRGLELAERPQYAWHWKERKRRSRPERTVAFSLNLVRNATVTRRWSENPCRTAGFQFHWGRTRPIADRHTPAFNYCYADLRTGLQLFRYAGFAKSIVKRLVSREICLRILPLFYRGNGLRIGNGSIEVR